MKRALSVPKVSGRRGLYKIEAHAVGIVEAARL